jgi:hypothetical protein
MMAFLHKLLAYLAGSELESPAIISSLWGGYLPAGMIDEYYANLRETRPYVIAMREIAADTTRSW